MAAYGDAILRVCFDHEPSEADLDRLGDHERWRLYRRMVQSRIDTLLGSALPRSLERLGAEARAAHVAAWFATERPRSRYFWRLPLDFATFLGPRLCAEDAPLAELLRFERASWEVRQRQTPAAPPTVGFSFERRPVLDPSVLVLHFAHPVHLADAPLDQPASTHLCLHRGADGALGVLALNPIAAALLEAMREGEGSLAELVRGVTEARGTAIDQAFLEKLGELIATFLERGILLGSLGD